MRRANVTLRVRLRACRNVEQVGPARLRPARRVPGAHSGPRNRAQGCRIIAALPEAMNRSPAIETLPYDKSLLAAHAQTIADNARELAALGWTPATSSNFSMRLDDRHAAVTVSGRDKGRLGADDIMVVDFDNRPVATEARPSAETALHTQIYRRFPTVGAVLHTHSRAQSVASRLFAGAGTVRFEGWELQKAISGYSTHESVLDLPVFPNTQDMAELVARIDAWLDAGKPLHGYLIDGHGIYAWGIDMAEARRHLEAFEFLLNCELDLRRLHA